MKKDVMKYRQPEIINLAKQLYEAIEKNSSKKKNAKKIIEAKILPTDDNKEKFIVLIERRHRPLPSPKKKLIQNAALQSGEQQNYSELNEPPFKLVRETNLN